MEATEPMNGKIKRQRQDDGWGSQRWERVNEEE